MTAIAQFLRNDTRLDRWAIALSGLCMVHCLTSAIFFALLASAGGLLADPAIHEIGLVLAIGFGVLALGGGVLRHRRLLPALFGVGGLATMATALALPHGGWETAATLAGVALLAFGHQLNRRAHG